MRILILTVAALVLGSLSGCKWAHSHGICDCEFDDYCASRAPWVRGNGVHASPEEGYHAPAPVTAPATLPEVKSKKL